MGSAASSVGCWRGGHRSRQGFLTEGHRGDFWGGAEYIDLKSLSLGEALPLHSSAVPGPGFWGTGGGRAERWGPGICLASPRILFLTVTTSLQAV